MSAARITDQEVSLLRQLRAQLDVIEHDLVQGRGSRAAALGNLQQLAATVVALAQESATELARYRAAEEREP